MMDDSDVAELLETMSRVKEEIEGSPPFKTLLQAEEDEFRANISRALGIQGHASMVIFELAGSVLFSPPARSRLALALLLKEQWSGWIEGVDVWCIRPSPCELRVMKKLGCRTIKTIPSHGCRGKKYWGTFGGPTVVFMPQDVKLVGDLLKENWSPSLLNRIIILGVSLKHLSQCVDGIIDKEGGRPQMAVTKLTPIEDRLRYVWAVEEWIEEIKMDEMHWWCAWTFFNVGLHVDMESLLPGTAKCSRRGSDSNCPDGMDEEDIAVAAQLHKEIEYTMEVLQASDYYLGLSGQLQGDPHLRSEISSRLGSEEGVQMVVYGLGSIEHNHGSLFQLALALLLRRDYSSILKIKGILICEPELSLADTEAMISLGCEVAVTIDEERRRIERPTVVFMPFNLYFVIDNFLEANWDRSALEKMVWLGNGLPCSDLAWLRGDPGGRQIENDYVSHETSTGCFIDWTKTWDDVGKDDKVRINQSDTSSSFGRAARDYLHEFRIDDVGAEPFPLHTISWYFFHLSKEEDLKASTPVIHNKGTEQQDFGWITPNHTFDDVRFLLSSTESVHSRHLSTYCTSKGAKFQPFVMHRGPRRLRWKWSKPPTGWLKLNFASRRISTNVVLDGDKLPGLAGYGGVFHDDQGCMLLSYGGSLYCGGDGDDSMVATAVEGLRQGLRCLKRLPDAERLPLLIETDELIVLWWLIKIVHPPQRFMKAYKEVWRVLKGMRGTAMHIYAKANAHAVELAEASAGHPCSDVWLREGDFKSPATAVQHT